MAVESFSGNIDPKEMYLLYVGPIIKKFKFKKKDENWNHNDQIMTGNIKGLKEAAIDIRVILKGDFEEKNYIRQVRYPGADFRGSTARIQKLFTLGQV